MGKKGKKKGSSNNKKKTKRNNASAQKNNREYDVTAAHSNNKRDSDQASLYSIYKHCTEAVMEWGKFTYKKKSKVKSSFSTSSLSHVIFDILGSLASDGVLMPEPVLRDLKLAISYRKRVGRFYRSLPNTSEEDHVRHEWLIQQLENLATAFRHNSTRNDNTATNAENEDREGSVMRAGFEVLALEDDGEDPVASTHDGDETKPRVILTTPPTPEELEAEERVFAISLLMCEIDDIRNDLKARWKDWAQQCNPETNQDEAGQNLLAVTSVSEYAMAAVRKQVLQVSIEIASFDDGDQVMAGFGESTSSIKQTSDDHEWKEKDLVTLHNLEKRPDLNGQHGFICKPVEDTDERVSLELFPTDSYASPDKKRKLSVKPENLVLSDNTYRRLCQIHEKLSSLDLDTIEIPQPPQMIYNAPTSVSVQTTGIAVIDKSDRFEKAIRNQDFESLLQLTVQYVMPLWISLTQYLPDVGAADAVFLAYIRDFALSRQVKFPLTFALLVVLDGALACNEDMAEFAKDISVEILDRAFNVQAYSSAINVLQNSGMKADALFSHLELARHLRGEYSIACLFFPLLSGEHLLSGLRMHFVCGSGLPYAFVESYTCVLHVYWMLRSEGYLGRINELERMLKMYRQEVFFRGGLARKGQEKYVKCHQLAIGATVKALPLLDGREASRRTGNLLLNQDALGMDGLHVSEISRLLDVLQWKSMPILDRNACFNEIHAIAQEEFGTVFTAPLLTASVKLSQLVEAFGRLANRAQISGAQMVSNFALHTHRMLPCPLVCFWALALGDDRSVVPGEKEECLALLASYFSRAFDEVQTIMPNEEPTLLFSPNDHRVDSSLWGEKGARKMEHLQV